MSANKSESEYSLHQNHDIVENPRKRFCVDHAGRKSWSLLERTTDEEVSRTPVPAFFRAKPLQQTEQQVLETSIIDEYLIEEETPLGQSVSAAYIPTTRATYSAGSDSSGGRQSYTPLGIEDDLMLERRHKSEPTESDSFKLLSDEMMLSVFSWLPKRTLSHCMLVCKRYVDIVVVFKCGRTKFRVSLLALNLGWCGISEECLQVLVEKAPQRLQRLNLGGIRTLNDDILERLVNRCPRLLELDVSDC
ncbi:hypothetical protein HF086_002459, partial [Spodoptera exigua]